MYKFNINDFIKVRLTNFGKDVYREYYESVTNEYNKFWGYTLKMPELDTDPNGFTKFQLWDFMRIFGKSFGPGIPNIIEDISIYLEEDDVRSTYIDIEEYNKVCAERDKLKEENNNWKIICNALVNNNDLPKYEGADDFKNV